MTGTQLPIDFGHSPVFTAEDFLIAPSNALAHDWVLRWPDWSAPALALIGPAGAGKSHLAHLFAERSGASLLAAAELGLDDPPRFAGQAVVVEDADRSLGDERALFHLYNLLIQSGGSLLITGRDEPAHWPVRLPDLRSRLAALPVARIDPPGDGLLQALLVKLFADRQIRVGEDVPAYLALRMERSFDAARALVAALDEAALADKKPVSVPLARRVLADLFPGAEDA